MNKYQKRSLIICQNVAMIGKEDQKSAVIYIHIQMLWINNALIACVSNFQIEYFSKNFLCWM